MTISHKIATTALALAAATTAAAGTAHYNIVTGEGHDGIDISVTVQEATIDGYDYEFVIENNTHCDDAGITGIYFESAWGSMFSSSAHDRNLRRDENPLNFVEGGVSPNIAGWSSSLVSYEIMGGVGNGVHSGHTATVAFMANDGVSLDDLDSVLATQGFGLGLRLQDMFADDPIATAWALAGTGQSRGDHNCGFGQGDLPDEGDGGGQGGDEATGVPTPSAALMGLALMGLAGKRRRRD
ncbi:MAG: MYXO-CTERM sorting domain-containing protein [Planctomycetota bacterium]